MELVQFRTEDDSPETYTTGETPSLDGGREEDRLRTIGKSRKCNGGVSSEGAGRG